MGNREIKFRAFDKNGNGMFYNIQNGIEFSDLSHYTFKDFLGNPDAIGDIHDWVIMQYTGLKDKNGKEIYEGDYLEYPSVLNSTKYGVREVSFSNGSFYAGVSLSLIDMKHIEIIGNIFENPNFFK